MSKDKKRDTHTSEKSDFKTAISKVPKLSLHEGLGAVEGKYRSKIQVKDPRKLCGSVDIDTDLKADQPEAARWDYVVGHDDKAYFIEIHPADTSNIKEIIKKLDWLKNWLKNSATDLDKLKAKAPFRWIASGRVNILPNSKEYRECAKQGILPKERISL